MVRFPVRSVPAAALPAVPPASAPRADSADALRVLSVPLPDGSVTRVHYVGDVPPALTPLVPVPIPAAPSRFRS